MHWVSLNSDKGELTFEGSAEKSCGIVHKACFVASELSSRRSFLTTPASRKFCKSVLDAGYTSCRPPPLHEWRGGNRQIYREDWIIYDYETIGYMNI